MTQKLTLEQTVAAYMAGEAWSRPSDELVDDILSATGRMRPEPRWLALLKEPPMRTQSRVAVGLPHRGLVLTAALVALLIVALAAVVVGANLLKQPQQLSSDDWPMFRGDAARAGVSLRGPSGRPVIRWQFHAQGAVTHSIAIVGDVVYATSDDGVVHALALTDGSERWHVPLAPGATSDPAVANGLLYVADSAGVVHALDATTGAQKWESGAFGMPLTVGVDNDATFVGTSAGLLIALDAKSGSERWRSVLAPSGPVSAATVANGMVYVGVAGSGLHALDATNGQIRWRLDTGTEATGTPVVANGIAYLGTSSEASTGHLYAADSSTGGLLWQVNETYQSPSVSSEMIFTGSSKGDISARDPRTGAERWHVRIPSTLHPMALVNGILYVPSSQERLVYALDAVSGGELWRQPIDGGIDCCAAVAKGAVFVGTTAGTVYAIGGDGSRLTAASVAPLPTTASPASPSPSPTAGTSAPPAEIVWTASPPNHGYNANGSIGVDPAGRIWVPDHQNNRFSILAADGTFIENWGKSGTGEGEFRLNRPRGDGYGGIAFASNGSFFVLDVGNRRVQKFDKDRKFLKAWGSFGSGRGQYSDPIAIQIGSDGRVYVLDDVRSVVETYDLNGKTLGSFDPFSNAPVNAGSNGFTLDKDGNVYVGQLGPDQVAVFDRNGKFLRTIGDAGDVRFSEQPGSIALDRQGRIYVTQGPSRGSAPGLLVFDHDGRYLAGFGPSDESVLGLHFPTGMLFDRQGFLILQDAGPIEVGDFSHGRILKLKLLDPLTQ